MNKSQLFVLIGGLAGAFIGMTLEAIRLKNAHNELVDRYKAMRRDRDSFVNGLTEALSAHGVPAMPTWREAIDWLAANGGHSSR